VWTPNGFWRNDTGPHMKSGSLRGGVLDLAVLVFSLSLDHLF
jgi:hypothetical protein